MSLPDHLLDPEENDDCPYCGRCHSMPWRLCPDRYQVKRQAEIDDYESDKERDELV